MRELIQLRIPQHKMSEFCQRKGYGDYHTLHPSARYGWVQMDEEEILLAYNTEMRGFANYYALANGAKRGLKKLGFLAESSFLATLAQKHDSSISKESSRLRQGRDLVVTVQDKNGKPRRYKFFKIRDWQPQTAYENVDKEPRTAHLRLGRSTLKQRIEAHICESCDKEGGYFEVHHVRKLKDLKGKAWWEQVMSRRRRKTLILCNECHGLLHAGTLSKRQKEF
jgi:Type II intron maturase